MVDLKSKISKFIITLKKKKKLKLGIYAVSKKETLLKFVVTLYMFIFLVSIYFSVIML